MLYSSKVLYFDVCLSVVSLGKKITKPLRNLESSYYNNELMYCKDAYTGCWPQVISQLLGRLCSLRTNFLESAKKETVKTLGH